MGRKQEKQNDTDSVALDSLVGGAPDSSGGKGNGPSSKVKKLLNFKILIAIFVLFALVVSDVFTNNVISGFRGAVQCRTPTSYGVVLQGIFLVIFYVLALHMIEGDII
jgi:hypothetical protein